MYSFIKTAHSYWAFIVLILLVLAIANAFVGIAKLELPIKFNLN